MTSAFNATFSFSVYLGDVESLYFSTLQDLFVRSRERLYNNLTYISNGLRTLHDDILLV